MQIDDSGAVTVMESQISCQSFSGVGSNCFEVNRDVVERLSLIDLATANTRSTATIVNGRFFESVGTGTGTTVVLGHVDGSDSFTVASIWHGITLNYAMGCSHPWGFFIEESDLSQTATTWVAPFATQSQTAPPTLGLTTTALWSTAAADVAVHRAPTAMAVYDLYAEVSNSPGGGANRWDIQLYMLGYLGYTPQLCRIDQVGATPDFDCFERLATIGYVSGNTPQQGDQIVLSITPNSTPIATDMWVSGCAGETPR
jgi:hypothetical protein